MDVELKSHIYYMLLEVNERNISPEEAQKELLDLLTPKDEKETINNTIYMGKEMLDCKLGIYEVFWISGGSSLAAIGITHSGQRWLAPINWTNSSDEIDPTGRLHNQLDHIQKIVLLYN